MPPLDRKAITEELELLQLEETRERVEEMRQARASRKMRGERRTQDLNDARAMQDAIQTNCWHKKGGKGVEQLAHGNDHNYAVIKHTLCHGPTIIICQRCWKVWERPDPVLNTKKSSVEDRAIYKKLWDEYQWALNLPTDNEPSGTQLFVFSKNEEPAA